MTESPQLPLAAAGGQSTEIHPTEVWAEVVAALEVQGQALRAGQGSQLAAANTALEQVSSALPAPKSPRPTGAGVSGSGRTPLRLEERNLIQRARELAKENALLLMSARNQVAQALTLFQAQARSGLA